VRRARPRPCGCPDPAAQHPARQEEHVAGKAPIPRRGRKQADQAVVAEAVAYANTAQLAAVLTIQGGDLNDCPLALARVELVRALSELCSPLALALRNRRQIDVDFETREEILEARRIGFDLVARAILAVQLGATTVLLCHGKPVESPVRGEEGGPEGRLLGEPDRQDLGQRAGHFVALDRAVVDEYEPKNSATNRNDRSHGITVDRGPQHATSSR
jgi:hypothetical protein